MRLFLSLVLVATFTFSCNSCTYNPATGRSQLDFGMSPEEEIALGTEAAPQFLSENGGEIPSPQILAYVREIGARLAASSERPELPWEFHVLDSKQINAFALPGGKVFFSRGLLEKMTNEAQVAAVMGHEVGHVTGKHINERIAQATGVGILGAAVGVAGAATNNEWLQVLGVGTQVGGGVYLLSFGRDQESEADKLGIRYMAQNGWNPVGMMEVMNILKEASAGGQQWEMLSTHPDPARRYSDAEKIIQKQYPDYNDTSKYVMGHDRFNQIVKANLAKMKPAKHGNATPKAPPNSALAKAMARMHELGNCACHTPQDIPLMMREAGDRR